MSSADKNAGVNYPVVGRNKKIDLEKYLVNIHGRDIIDYEKIRRDEPELYEEILNDEQEANRRDDEEIGHL